MMKPTQAIRISQQITNLIRRYGWTFCKFGLVFIFLSLVVEQFIHYFPIFDWLKLIDQSIYFSLAGAAFSIVIKYIRDHFNRDIEILRQGQQQNNKLIQENYLEIVESIRTVDNRVSSIKTSMNAFQVLIEKDDQHDKALQEIRRDFAQLLIDHARLEERQAQDARLALFMRELNKHSEGQNDLHRRLDNLTESLKTK